MKILKTSIVIFSLVFPLFSLAAGLQISPARLDIIMGTDQQTTENIVFANPTSEVQIFEITADDFGNRIQPWPKSFTLESGARKTITIKITSEGWQKMTSQKIVTNLSVIAKPLDKENLAIGAGAKIPVEITINQTSQNNTKKLVPIIVIILGVAFLIALLKYKRRS